MRDGGTPSARRRAGRAAGAVTVTLAIAAVLVAREQRAVASGLDAGRSSGQAEAQRQGASDSALVSELLNSVRGAGPTLCALAARSVDGRFGWGGMPMVRPLSGRDSQSRAVIDWMDRDRKDRRDPASVAILAAALSDTDRCVRRVAAPLLGHMRDAAATDRLLEALRSRDANTREMAALGLGMAESARSVNVLVNALSDDVAEVRAMAAWALGEIEDRAAVPPLTTALRRDRDAEVRRVAAWALGKMH